MSHIVHAVAEVQVKHPMRGVLQLTATFAVEFDQAK
jgi:hypothetical protein